MCLFPISIRYNPPKPDGKGGLLYSFPADCGKCIQCLTKRKAQWSFRMVEEQRQSFSSYFVTLTYDDKHLPYGEVGPSGNKKDHMEFIKWLKYFESPKRLKKRNLISMEELERKRRGVDTKGKKLRYYGIIEYGDQKGRPHMHYIIYNIHDVSNIATAWSNIRKVARGIYKPGEAKGLVHIDECNVNTIDYVLKYMVKERKEGEEDRQREVSFMSKGLGLSVADEEFIKHIKKPDGGQVLSQRGNKVPLPRYYAKKFLTDEEREKKSQYVAGILEENEKRFERECIAAGLNPDKVRVQQMEAGSNALKNRQKRSM